MHPQSTTSPAPIRIPQDMRATIALTLPRVPCKTPAPLVPGAFLYARRSKPGQTSIERQWRRAEQYAYDLDVTPTDRSKDEKSGLRLDRAGLQYMLQQARKRAFSHLILYMSDRLAREDQDFLDIVYELIDLGIKVYCTYDGEITRTNAADLAAKAKRRVVEDSRRFMAAAKDNAMGGMKLGPPPIGYMKGDEPGRYVEDTAGVKYRKPSGPVVRELFRRYAADEPFCHLQRWFNEELRLKKPLGELRRLLNNPYYRGLNINCRMMDSDIEGKKPRPDDYVEWNYHPNALCDEGTWPLVEARLQREARVGQQRASGPRHPLTGLVHCMRCDRRMAFHTKRSKAEWRCDVCHASRSETKIVGIVDAHISRVVLSPDVMQGMLAQRVGLQRQAAERELANVEAQIGRLTKLRKGYQDMRALGELDGPEYMARIRESDREWEGLQAQREGIARRLAERGDSPAELTELLRFATTYRTMVEWGKHPDVDTARSLYLRIVQAIRLDPERATLYVDWAPGWTAISGQGAATWDCPAGRHAVPRLRWTHDGDELSDQENDIIVVQRCPGPAMLPDGDSRMPVHLHNTVTGETRHGAISPPQEV